jgi:Cu-Zn family superoxide dismutase
MRATDNPHWGDMPNIYADATGSGHAEAFIKGLTQADLRDEDGSALIVHTKADDYTTQPSGDAGDRVACAVIAPPRKETP